MFFQIYYIFKTNSVYFDVILVHYLVLGIKFGKRERSEKCQGKMRLNCGFTNRDLTVYRVSKL